MPDFEYRGVDRDGLVVSGIASGQSLDEVANQLSTQGVVVHQLGMVAASVATAPPPQGPPGAPPTDARSTFETRVSGQFVGVVPLVSLQFFFGQLGTLLDAGINPADALETLSRQANVPKLSSILKECKEHVISGRPISAGLQRYPEVFSPLMLSMVRVGEEGGFLSNQCNMLSEYIRRDVELRNSIKRETMTHKITLFGSIIVILGTNLIIQAVAPGGAGLPVPWAIWGFALIVGVAVYFFKKLALPQPQVRRSFDDFVLKIPGVGGMVHGFAMAKFGRAFGALYKGGVALPKAVQLAADACGNESIRARVYPAAQSLKEGAGITDTLASTGAFSPLVLDMSRTGETTGNMDQMLDKMSDFYEEEGALKAQMAAKVIGVVCLIFVAVYVLFILVSFYSGFFARIGSAGD